MLLPRVLHVRLADGAVVELTGAALEAACATFRAIREVVREFANDDTDHSTMTLDLSKFRSYDMTDLATHNTFDAMMRIAVGDALDVSDVRELLRIAMLADALHGVPTFYFSLPLHRLEELFKAWKDISGRIFAIACSCPPVDVGRAWHQAASELKEYSWPRERPDVSVYVDRFIVSRALDVPASRLIDVATMLAQGSDPMLDLARDLTPYMNAEALTRHATLCEKMRTLFVERPEAHATVQKLDIRDFQRLLDAVQETSRFSPSTARGMTVVTLASYVSRFGRQRDLTDPLCVLAMWAMAHAKDCDDARAQTWLAIALTSLVAATCQKADAYALGLLHPSFAWITENELTSETATFDDGVKAWADDRLRAPIYVGNADCKLHARYLLCCARKLEAAEHVDARVLHKAFATIQQCDDDVSGTVKPWLAALRCCVPDDEFRWKVLLIGEVEVVAYWDELARDLHAYLDTPMIARLLEHVFQNPDKCDSELSEVLNELRYPPNSMATWVNPKIHMGEPSAEATAAHIEACAALVARYDQGAGV